MTTELEAPLQRLNGAHVYRKLVEAMEMAADYAVVEARVSMPVIRALRRSFPGQLRETRPNVYRMPQLQPRLRLCVVVE